MDLRPILSGGIAALMFLAVIALVVYRRHNKINMFWALLAILLSGGTMLMAVVGSSVGTIYSQPFWRSPQQRNRIFRRSGHRRL